MAYLPYGSALLILEFSSISKGYDQLNKTLNTFNVKALEAFTMVNGDIVGVLNGQTNELESVAKKINRKKIKSFYFVRNCPESLIKGFYGLLKTQTKESIFVAEFINLSKLFQAAELGVEKQLEIVEIRSGRSLFNKNLLILTGTNQNLDSFEKDFKRKKIKTIHATVVKDMNLLFRESFGFF